MSEHRPQTVPVDPHTRQATGSIQWFLELNGPPITHNNQLVMFVCGQEGFADIAEKINHAKKSIDIICWGFDPAMELVRSGTTWPRGETYGDLLTRKAGEGVQVRLLIWYNLIASKIQESMPGYSHDRTYIRRSWTGVPKASDFLGGPTQVRRGLKKVPDLTDWRAQYCAAWYDFAMKGTIPNLEIRLRDGKALESMAALEQGSDDDIEKEKISADMSEFGFQAFYATHHQKPLLIDYDADIGQSASTFGYVMGLNSVTAYWDTSEHLIDSPFRETTSDDKENKAGFNFNKPYRDYACRVRGDALICLNRNFCQAWDRAAPNQPSLMAQRQTPPAAIKALRTWRDSQAQIIRTQPEDRDKTIKRLYFHVVSAARDYIYIENQYFFYEEFAQRLMTLRKDWVALWKTAKRVAADVPPLHVFVVMPQPETDGMIPRTYDTLATLGQSAAMPGQVAALEEFNDPKKLSFAVNADAMRHSSAIKVPDLSELEQTYGLKILPLVLTTSGMVKLPKNYHYQMAYRDIYIHSKLMIIDDGFFTVGSANISQRSMAVDSEINIATDDQDQARKLRERIWGDLTKGKLDGGSGSRKEIADTFDDWKKLAQDNKDKKAAGQDRLSGFLMPLEVTRSATFRVG